MTKIKRRPGRGRPPKPGGVFGMRLYRLRRRAGFTQVVTAARLGVAISTYKGWERGEHAPPTWAHTDVLARLAAAAED